MSIRLAPRLKHPIALQDYEKAILATDRLANEDLRPILMGLFGEVGSIMAPAKKFRREKQAYAGYYSAVEEEFGDALWYFSALARRTRYDLSTLLSDAVANDSYSQVVTASNVPESPIAHLSRALDQGELDEVLLDLGRAATALFALTNSLVSAKELLGNFAKCYLRALQASQVPFSAVISKNLAKTLGRFVDTDPNDLPNFDAAFDEDERLPDVFEISIVQGRSGHSSLKWNGVFIGDPLTDNILDRDGYRFHDEFHFAHAAVLHWSPTFRALIKHKRKSDKVIDEAQDGGRAIVVEEGLTAWLFTRAKDLNFFEDQSGVSFDLLKTVHQFVQGYEVDECPLKLWESAILQGYSVFRQLRDEGGGIVVANRNTRTVAFRSLKS